jgi:hypothetical protein
MPGGIPLVYERCFFPKTQHSNKMDFLNSLQVTFAKATTQPNTTSQIDVKMIFLGAAVEGGREEVAPVLGCRPR